MKSLFAFLPATALLASAAVAAPPKAPNWQRGTPLSVTMTNKGYSPRRIVMQPGGQYILHFHNPSDRTHDFTAGDFFAQARVSPRDQGIIPRNRVELKPGTSTSLHLIAPTTRRAVYAFKSERIADAASNFKGEIVVR
jgi:uncharacterized cupredoxin-like copper-binding protein